MTSDGVLEALRQHAALPVEPSFADVVEAVRSLPYGRPSERSVAGVVADGRGTCSTKHALLWLVADERWPGLQPRLVHRVYRLERADARALFGPAAAAIVPDEGLVDVHRYLTVAIDGRRVAIDATFPGGPRWDGRSAMALACASGEDYPAGNDPDADKRELERSRCDPSLREPFIAALSSGQR